MTKAKVTRARAMPRARVMAMEAQERARESLRATIKAKAREG
jgi:hypothetical protein